MVDVYNSVLSWLKVFLDNVVWFLGVIVYWGVDG